MHNLLLALSPGGGGGNGKGVVLTRQVLQHLSEEYSWWNPPEKLVRTTLHTTANCQTKPLPPMAHAGETCL